MEADISPIVEPDAPAVSASQSSAVSALVAPPREPLAVVAPHHEIAVLFNGGAKEHAELAGRLEQSLPTERYWVTLTDIDEGDARPMLDALRARPALYVVAIGLAAARLARNELDAPLVFAQVFNHQELGADGRAIRGVRATPPLALQAQAWKRLDPTLERVGLIVSERHVDLIAEAQHAAEAASLVVEHEVSASDRETLYLFKRLAPQIDGLWLFPDDRILSPVVLRELLDYAIAHEVRVCVFSGTLLSWGAFMSATSTITDVARTMRHVLERIIAGSTDELPIVSPLTELELRVNDDVAVQLGFQAAPSSWIVSDSE